jgi:ABC-type glutathione transport system ATPase component
MTQSDRGRSSAPRPPALSVRDLAKVYGRGPASVRALDGVSLDVDAGTSTGRAGANRATDASGRRDRCV